MIVSITGKPGSGKSTVAQELATRLRQEKKVALLCGDHFYYTIAGIKENSKEINEVIAQVADAYQKKGFLVILEGMWIPNIGKKIFLSCERAVAKERFAQKPRVKERIERGYDFEDFERWYAASEPEAGETIIDATQSTDKIIEQITAVIEQSH